MLSETNQTAATDLNNERELIMWEPLHFEVTPGYDYLRSSPLQRLGTLLLRSFAYCVLSVYNRLAVGMKITGRENLRLLRGRGAVVVCNHIHPLDCTMLDMALAGRRTYYISLQSTFRIPLIRHIVRILGAVPISSSARCTAELFSQMTRAVNDGAMAVIYPEGVMKPYCEQLRDFKSGAFRMAASGRLPVLPCSITQRRPRGIYALYKKRPCLQINILPPVFCDETLGHRAAAQKLQDESRRAINYSIGASE